MSTTVGTRPRATAEPNGRGPTAVADVFVIFGITGDLAKVMTFHSLYRLERRGLLDCPIVGVDAVEECRRIKQPLRDDPAPAYRYAKGTWGPKEANQLVAGHGGWHEPWVAR